MAGTNEPVVLLKPVQELAVDCNTPPRRYIHKRSDEDINVSPPVIDISVIDLDCIQSSSPSAEKELEKLRTCLASCGCFQVVGHGMTTSFLDQVHSIGKDFFALPLSEKRKWSKTAEVTEGYGNDSELSEHQILDWNDRLYLTTNPQDQRKYQFWPQNPENFREILQEYTEKIILLNQVVLKALSRSLNLQENCFLDQYGENSNMVTRFNYYPPCPRPDLSLGVKQHADGSAITFLLQDNQVEGLQVLKDDQWFSVPTVPNALLVNVGDQLEIMSNGIFTSPLHRVVTNSERERTTVAVFCCPDSSRYIEPAEDLISETSPRLYKKIKNYTGIFFENYQQGKRAIEAVKITAEDNEGYGNETVHSEHQILDWADRLYLTTNPADQRRFQFWPQNPESFREILLEYTEKLILLNKVVLKALSRSLNLKENCFLDQFGETTNMLTRYNYYPPCPRPDLTLGVREHADGSAITFVLQDNGVGGFQVLKDDQWFSVPTVPNALLVNVGDQVEIMSNGIFKSPLHRGVTNSERDRMTVATFCTPDSSRHIEPAEELILETSPRLYKKVKNYVRIFFDSFQQGKRAIEAVKL